MVTFCILNKNGLTLAELDTSSQKGEINSYFPDKILSNSSSWLLVALIKEKNIYINEK